MESEVQGKQFTKQEIQICLKFTLAALGVGTSTFSIFLLRLFYFPTARPAGLWSTEITLCGLEKAT